MKTQILFLALLTGAICAQERSLSGGGSKTRRPNPNTSTKSRFSSSSSSSSAKSVATFNCPQDFGYYAHPSECSKYYVCVFGGALLEECTGGLMYSNILQTCDWPRNVVCNSAAGAAEQPGRSQGRPAKNKIQSATESLAASSSSTLLSRGLDNSIRIRQPVKSSGTSKSIFDDSSKVDREGRLFQSNQQSLTQRLDRGFQAQETSSRAFNVVPSSAASPKSKLTFPWQKYILKKSRKPRDVSFQRRHDSLSPRQTRFYYDRHHNNDNNNNNDNNDNYNNYNNYGSEPTSNRHFEFSHPFSRPFPSNRERDPSNREQTQEHFSLIPQSSFTRTSFKNPFERSPPRERGPSLPLKERTPFYNSDFDNGQTGPSFTFEEDTQNKNYQPHVFTQYPSQITNPFVPSIRFHPQEEVTSFPNWRNDFKHKFPPSSFQQQRNPEPLPKYDPKQNLRPQLYREPQRNYEPEEAPQSQTNHEMQGNYEPQKNYEPAINIHPQRNYEPQPNYAPEQNHETHKNHEPQRYNEPQRNHEPERSYEPQRNNDQHKSHQPKGHNKLHPIPVHSTSFADGVDLKRFSVFDDPFFTRHKLPFTNRDKDETSSHETFYKRPEEDYEHRDTDRKPVMLNVQRNPSSQNFPPAFITNENKSEKRPFIPPHIQGSVLLSPPEKESTAAGRPLSNEEEKKKEKNKNEDENVNPFINKAPARRRNKLQSDKKENIVNLSTRNKNNSLQKIKPTQRPSHREPTSTTPQPTTTKKTSTVKSVMPRFRPRFKSKSTSMRRPPQIPGTGRQPELSKLKVKAPKVTSDDRPTSNGNRFVPARATTEAPKTDNFGDFLNLNDTDYYYYYDDIFDDYHEPTAAPTTTTAKPSRGLSRGSSRNKPSASNAKPGSQSGGRSPDVVGRTPQRLVRPSKKPLPQSSGSSYNIDIWKYPPRRPNPLYPQPQADVLATKCDRNVCKLPDCSCGQGIVPGDIPVDQAPQLVLLTFDDAVNDLNKVLYQDLFERGRRNPNGCPIAATFYVSHEWTDYTQVHNLYADGHEIASHSVTHSFGEQFSTAKWAREIGGQREIMSAYGGVRMEDIRGMRAPFLAVGGNNMFRMLYDLNFTYDSSMPVYENNPPSWPYTLDYKIFHDCMIPPCPTNSYPGVWQVPMVMWQDLLGGRCSMGDACTTPPDAEGVYKMLIQNFERHYTTNRAPMGLFYHAAWFSTAHHKEGFIAFLDTIAAMDDVWLVTNWQMLQWVRDPKPLAQAKAFKPFQCDYPERPPRCTSPKVCNVWHKGSVRYMKTCHVCPDSYPWTGNTGVKSPLNNL